jgi:hypothetical protein
VRVRKNCSTSHTPSAEKRSEGVGAHLFEQPIEVAVLQLLDFRLVVGKSDVEMIVRHHVDGELPLWREADGVRGVAAFPQHDPRGRVRGELGDREFEPLLAEAAGRQRGAIVRAGDGERELPRPRNPGRRHSNVHQLANPAVRSHVEIGWRDVEGRGWFGRLGVAHQFQRIPVDRGVAGLIRRVVHGRDLELVLPLVEQRTWHRDPRPRFAVDGRVHPAFGKVGQLPVEVHGARRAVQVQLEAG